MTSTIARVTVFYLSQYFVVPTRVASWAFRFCKFYSFIFCMPCHYTLVSQNSLLILINAFTLCTLSSWSFILYSGKQPCHADGISHLHHVQVNCTCLAFPGMALVTALEQKSGGPTISLIDHIFPSPRVKRWHALMPGVAWMRVEEFFG